MTAIAKTQLNLIGVRKPEEKVDFVFSFSRSHISVVPYKMEQKLEEEGCSFLGMSDLLVVNSDPVRVNIG